MLPFLAESREKYPCNGCKQKTRDIIFIRHLVTTPFRLNLHDKTAPNLSNEIGVAVKKLPVLCIWKMYVTKCISRHPCYKRAVLQS